MPARIKVLVWAYVAVLFLLPLLSVCIALPQWPVDAELWMTLISVSLLAHFTIATPLGMWSVLGSTRRSWRILATVLSALGPAVMIAGLQMIALLEAIIADGYTIESILSDSELLMGVIYLVISLIVITLWLLAPVGLGAVVAWVCRMRGLHIKHAKRCATIGGKTRLTTRQLLGITFLAATALSIQPVLLAYFGDLAYATPAALASIVGMWTVLSLDSPWRRMLWGAPLAAMCAALLISEETNALEAFVSTAVFFAFQSGVLGVVRSAGYRLIWSTCEVAAEAATGESNDVIVEPAIA